MTNYFNKGDIIIMSAVYHISQDSYDELQKYFIFKFAVFLHLREMNIIMMTYNNNTDLPCYLVMTRIMLNHDREIASFVEFAEVGGLGDLFLKRTRLRWRFYDSIFTPRKRRERRSLHCLPRDTAIELRRSTSPFRAILTCRLRAWGWR